MRNLGYVPNLQASSNQRQQQLVLPSALSGYQYQTIEPELPMSSNSASESELSALSSVLDDLSNMSSSSNHSIPPSEFSYSAYIDFYIAKDVFN